MKIVDTRGQKCPKPIIETKKALRESLAGETFQVVTDNKTSFMNISRFLGDHKIRYVISEKGGVWKFRITNVTGETVPLHSVENTSAEFHTNTKTGFAVAISSEFMGQGDDDLGRQLMKSFFISLGCLDEMTSVIVFYNSGVRLALSDSPVIDIIKEMRQKGSEIILCGTCVDHFKIGDRLGAGIIRDMYIITQKLSEASNVIRP